MKKIIKATVFFVFCLIVIPIQNLCASSQDEKLLNEQLEMLDFSAVDSVISKNGNAVLDGESLGELVLKVIKGELNLSAQNIIQMLLDSFFAEVKALMSFMRHMLAIAVLSAFFKAFSLSFKNGQVAELGFFVNFLAVIAVLLSSFSVCIGLMQGLVSEVCSLMTASLPLIISLVVLSGNVTAGYIFNPVIIFFIQFAANFILAFVSPLIICASVMQIISYISNKDMLQKFAEFLKGIVSWGVKIMAGLFISVLSVQRLSVPIMNKAVTGTSKFLVNLVPVVGQALTGAVDAVFYWSSAVRGGVMVAVVIVIVLMCLAPVLQVAAFVLVYKLTAALIQPISDERIVKAIDAAGSFASLILGVCVLVAIMFIFMVMIVLSL